MLTVVTTCTPDYPKAWVFPSLARLSCRVVCLLDPADTRTLPPNVERAPYQTPGVLYQDGRFLDALDARDDDLIVLADADAVFQRDFEADELHTLDNLDGFALGYNARPGQKGAEEYQLLRPKQPITEAAQTLGLPVETLKGCWIYNTGFAAARASAWKRLRTLFRETVGDKGPGMFSLHSWPQYFICLTFCHRGVRVTELGYETHSHAHLPLTPKHRISAGKLLYDGRVVLFAHNCPGVA